LNGKLGNGVPILEVVRRATYYCCIMATSEPKEPEGVPNSIPTKTADAVLKLTDEGIEMPCFLKGHVGKFKIRTPNIDGEYETTDAGMPENEYYDGPIAAMPGDGDYNGDIPEGHMAVSTPELPETTYKVADERTE